MVRKSGVEMEIGENEIEAETRKNRGTVWRMQMKFLEDVESSER